MTQERRKPPVAEGDVVAGKYRVDRVLGAGGMGVVVAATHTALGQRVALKFILPDALKGPESVERFLREAKASVRLKSEHVARVYDVGKLDGPGQDADPFIVMELLEGCDLAKLSRRQAPVSVADATEYVLQACEALIEAHGNGIIHRDLKPQNLFVCRRMNGSPLVKVLDFGIFKATGPAAVGQMSLTDSTAVLGSPLYMAPEQMRAARNADARSDVWSLGVILYELLGGRVPFDGDTATEVCLKVAMEEPEPLANLRAGLPDALVKIVMRCLEKQPDKRFSTVAQLAAALEPFSASAQRGALDRPWRSLIDTVDQLEISANPEPLPSGEKVRTGVTWGTTRHGPSRPPILKNKQFARGIAVGLAVALASSAFVYALTMRKGAVTSASASSAPAVPPPTPDPVPSPGGAVTSPPATHVDAPVTSAAEPPSVPEQKPHRPLHSVSPAPKAKPVAAVPPSASVATSSPPNSAQPRTVAPNGTPILPPTLAPNGAPILK